LKGKNTFLICKQKYYSNVKFNFRKKKKSVHIDLIFFLGYIILQEKEIGICRKIISKQAKKDPIEALSKKLIVSDLNKLKKIN
jgi:hypothetical protein